ncbi:hypothetical protein ACQJBY_042323 [Aegilops geniculata]
MAEADAQTQSNAHSSSPPAEASGEPIRPPQVGAPSAGSPTFPLMYPMLVPGMFSQQGMDDQAQGPGIYAIQENQFMGAMGGYAPKTFIPLAYNIPTYQTGAITPFLRWLQRAGGVAARPPQAPANRAPVAAQNDGNDQPPGGNLADPANPDQAAENQEPGAAAGNENQQGAEGEANRRSWLGGILKEVQLVVVGFVASLLPGFQHND